MSEQNYSNTCFFLHPYLVLQKYSTSKSSTLKSSILFLLPRIGINIYTKKIHFKMSIRTHTFFSDKYCSFIKVA